MQNDNNEKADEASELFDRYATEHIRSPHYRVEEDTDTGALFSPSLNSFVERTLWSSEAKNISGQSFRMAAGYLESYSPNAFADQFESHFILGMHVALHGAIEEFSAFCFTQARFFPEIGDPGMEHSPEPLNDYPPGLWLIGFTRLGGRVTPEHAEHVIPQCPVRVAFARYLALLMSRAAWMHEFSHAILGHIGYVRKRRIALRLCEIAEPLPIIGRIKPPVMTTAQCARVLQALEFDADQSSFWACTRIQTDGLENIEGIRALDLRLRLKLALFASYAMSWLFEAFQAYLGSSDEPSHPPPYLRLHHLFRIGASNLDPLVANYAGLNQEAIYAFDAIQCAIQPKYAASKLYEDIENPQLQAELTRYADEIETLRPMLDRHAYFTGPDRPVTLMT